MRRLLSLVFLAAACADPGSTTPTAPDLGTKGSDHGTACVLNAQMSPEGHDEQSAASGHTQIKVRNDGTIEYKSFILNPAAETFFVGHIHRGAADVHAGPPVFGLFRQPASSEKQIQDRGEAPASADLARELCETPEAFYVNYHTVTEPGGAIRGQLGR